eukprot:Gb_06647 [translate_table: standard]
MAIRSLLTAAILVLIGVVVLTQKINAQDLSAPAPAPFSDGTAVDQGIAYILMFVALLITYLIH